MARRKPVASRLGVVVERTVDLLLARCGPQDLPWSKSLLWKLVWLALAVDYFGTILLAEAETTMLRFVVSFACGLVLPWLALTLVGKRERYVQTLTALLATGIVVTLVFLPLALAAIAFGMTEATGDSSSARQGLVALLLLAVMVWKIWVVGNIWHHALEWPFLAGIGVALLMFAFELGLDRLLFGVAPA